jgi:hypothetical protein
VDLQIAALRKDQHPLVRFCFIYVGLVTARASPIGHHGIFTEVGRDLECVTSVCYFEVVAGFGCINLVFEAYEEVYPLIGFEMYVDY